MKEQTSASQHLLGRYGVVRLDKCTVFSPEGDLSACPEEVHGARGERLLGITVLGIPVGSDEFVVRALEDAVIRLAPDRSQGAAPARVTSLERLSRLDDPQVAHLLLRFCAHPRGRAPLHLLRG